VRKGSPREGFNRLQLGTGQKMQDERMDKKGDRQEDGNCLIEKGKAGPESCPCGWATERIGGGDRKVIRGRLYEKEEKVDRSFEARSPQQKRNDQTQIGTQSNRPVGIKTEGERGREVRVETVFYQWSKKATAGEKPRQFRQGGKRRSYEKDCQPRAGQPRSQ